MTTNKHIFDPDDARLTAYALGELDAAEMPAVEALLAESADARAFVDEIRATAQQLSTGFSATLLANMPGEEPALTNVQRETLDREINAAMPQPARTFKLRPWTIAKIALPVAAAAAIVISMTLPSLDTVIKKPTNIEGTQLGYPVQSEQLTVSGGAAEVAGIKDESKQPGLKREFEWTESLKERFVSTVEDLEDRPSVVAETPALNAPSESPPPPVMMKPKGASKANQMAVAEPQRFAAGRTPTDTRGVELAYGQTLYAMAPERSSSTATARGRAYVGDALKTPQQNYYYADSDLRKQPQTQPMLGTSMDLYQVQSAEKLTWGLPIENAEAWRYNDNFNTEAYARIVDNPFLVSADDPLSTFSIDVDTASYANMRRIINAGQLPPPDAVRIEELINYFDYDYPQPATTKDVAEAIATTDSAKAEDAQSESAPVTPFSVNVDVASCPWKTEHQLMRIGLKGWEIPADQRPPCNLVFLIDVSGSMKPANKLPLLKDAMRMLAGQLNPDDRVAMVVYAGASGLVLPSTTAENAETIRYALDRLEAGGSTNGGAGIELAYKTATEHFIKGGINRVILATDGDFNVGTTNHGDLTRLIEEKAKTGVFLTVLGFGMGNYKDTTLETLADKGNGNYAYIDTADEARKVLVQEVGSTLITIAKDVKIQIEFNPLAVGAYRLIGYENRMLAARDFNDDTKDAGEIGAGHTVTALYEIVPVGMEGDLPQADGTTGEAPGVDPLKYQIPQQTTAAAESGELATIKLRYKQPDADKSTLIEFPIAGSDIAFADAAPDFKFAAAVASFGMQLRHSPYRGNASFNNVLEWAAAGLGEDQHGYRAAFIQLVTEAMSIKPPVEGPAQDETDEPAPQPVPMPAPQNPAPVNITR